MVNTRARAYIHIHTYTTYFVKKFYESFLLLLIFKKILLIFTFFDQR